MRAGMSRRTQCRVRRGRSGLDLLAPVGYRVRYQWRYLESMPALNVEFSEEEMARLRERAALTGRSLKQHVHDVTVEEADRISFVEGAVAEAARILPGIAARFPEGQR